MIKLHRKSNFMAALKRWPCEWALSIFSVQDTCWLATMSSLTAHLPSLAKLWQRFCSIQIGRVTLWGFYSTWWDVDMHKCTHLLCKCPHQSHTITLLLGIAGGEVSSENTEWPAQLYVHISAKRREQGGRRPRLAGPADSCGLPSWLRRTWYPCCCLLSHCWPRRQAAAV